MNVFWRNRDADIVAEQAPDTYKSACLAGERRAARVYVQQHISTSLILIGSHPCRIRTGDTAVLEGTPPYWRILGRTSVDIIKSGGYKVSALAVENALLAHSRIRECAVLGLPHDSLGEAIAAVIACKGAPVRCR